jgi:choline dehydrogenase-like flavoprotein
MTATATEPLIGVVNAGSSSLKFSVYEGERRLISGQVEGVGVHPSASVVGPDGAAQSPPDFVGEPPTSPSEALATILPWLREQLGGRRLAALGHRVPESKGQVHITAADARRPPAINFNFLSAPPDAELTVRAVRIARSVMTAPAMTPFQVTELAPGADRTTDDEILDWVKKAAETTYHPVGTCKMGSDPMAVVDAQLRVHGIEGLRVADASIMPTLTSGNTNAPSIMIGEKAADMVLNTAT